MSGIKRIFIIGQAGAGKGLVAKTLAQKLGWNIFDADFGMEYTMGRSLQQILGEDGSKSFHQRETEILAHMLSRENVVINTDAAIVDNEKNRQILSNEFTVFVNVSTDIQLQRLAESNQEPLLPVTDLESFLNKLHEDRDHFYDEVSNFAFSSDDGKLEEHVNSIINAIS